MLNLVITDASLFFPCGRFLRLAKSGTSSMNLLTLTKNVTLAVVDCCTPPPVRLTAHCIAAGSLIAASVISPNAVTISSAVHMITEIYDNC